MVAFSPSTTLIQLHTSKHNSKHILAATQPLTLWNALSRWTAAVQMAKARVRALREAWYAQLYILQRQGFDRWRRFEADQEAVAVPELAVVPVTPTPPPVSGKRLNLYCVLRKISYISLSL